MHTDLHLALIVNKMDRGGYCFVCFKQGQSQSAQMVNASSAFKKRQAASQEGDSRHSNAINPLLSKTSRHSDFSGSLLLNEVGLNLKREKDFSLRKMRARLCFLDDSWQQALI